MPASVVPTISSVTATRLDNGVPSGWGKYIQNRSGATLAASGAAGSYGSTITSYTFSGKTSSATVLNSTQTSAAATVDTITASGTVTFSVYVTDSRGRTSKTVTTSISVTPYTLPSISAALAFRCNASGESYEEGTYISAQCGVTYTPLDGQNTITANCSYQKLGDGDSWMNGASGISFDRAYVFGGGGVSTDYTYRVKFTVQDAFATVERIVDVSTASYTMFFKRGGSGVGIGKVSERNFALEINPDWSIYHGNFQLLPAIYSPSKPSNPVEGLIWLQPKG